MSYTGFIYGPTGQQIYPTPRESPGKYKPRPLLNREIKRSISQYDHAELVSLSASLCCRIPALRAAIRDKNSWAFSNWQPMYAGDNEKWGEAAEEYLLEEVLPNAFFRELRADFQWGMRVSGMSLDMHGDDLFIMTEDENGNPKCDIVPSPRIGNGLPGFQWVSTMYSGAFMTSLRADGMGVVQDGRYKDLPIYNGVIRRDGRPIAVRVLGFKANGETTFTDIDLGFAAGAHYACEMEFFGQGRGIPRPAASVLQWMKKEEIDDQLLKALANAAQRAVIHKLPPGMDAAQARGNAIEETTRTVTDANGNQEEKSFWVENSPDGNVTYIGSDEDLSGLAYENPHSNVEDFANRVVTECLADLGWSIKMLVSDGTSGAPTRLEVQKANNSIAERQSIQEIRSIQFFQHAIAKGMQNGRIPKNYDGLDPYKWAIGFPAILTVDSGNDVASQLQRLKFGLTNERMEAAKEGYIAKRILAQREKEMMAKIKAADRAFQFVQTLGHTDFTYQQAMELFWQPNPNSSATAKITEAVTDPEQWAQPQPSNIPPKAKGKATFRGLNP